MHKEMIDIEKINISINVMKNVDLSKKLTYLRASLCKILISSFAHQMDFAHNFSV